MNSPTWTQYTCAGLSLLLSLIAFVVGVDALRGRFNFGRPLGNLMTIYDMAVKNKTDLNSCSIYPCIVKALNKHLSSEKEDVHQRAMKMRLISYLILASTASTILFAVKYLDLLKY